MKNGWTEELAACLAAFSNDAKHYLVKTDDGKTVTDLRKSDFSKSWIYSVSGSWLRNQLDIRPPDYYHVYRLSPFGWRNVVEIS